MIHVLMLKRQAQFFKEFLCRLPPRSPEKKERRGSLGSGCRKCSQQLLHFSIIRGIPLVFTGRTDRSVRVSGSSLI